MLCSPPQSNKMTLAMPADMSLLKDPSPSLSHSKVDGANGTPTPTSHPRTNTIHSVINENENLNVNGRSTPIVSQNSSKIIPKSDAFKHESSSNKARVRIKPSSSHSSYSSTSDLNRAKSTLISHPAITTTRNTRIDGSNKENHDHIRSHSLSHSHPHLQRTQSIFPSTFSRTSSNHTSSINKRTISFIAGSGGTGAGRRTSTGSLALSRTTSAFATLAAKLNTKSKPDLSNDSAEESKHKEQNGIHLSTLHTQTQSTHNSKSDLAIHAIKSHTLTPAPTPPSLSLSSSKQSNGGKAAATTVHGDDAPIARARAAPTSSLGNKRKRIPQHQLADSSEEHELSYSCVWSHHPKNGDDNEETYHEHEDDDEDGSGNNEAISACAPPFSTAINMNIRRSSRRRSMKADFSSSNNSLTANVTDSSHDNRSNKKIQARTRTDDDAVEGDVYDISNDTHLQCDEHDEAEHEDSEYKDEDYAGNNRMRSSTKHGNGAAKSIARTESNASKQAEPKNNTTKSTSSLPRTSSTVSSGTSKSKSEPTSTSKKKKVVSTNYRRINLRKSYRGQPSKRGKNVAQRLVRYPSKRYDDKGDNKRKWLSYNKYKRQQQQVRDDSMYAELLDADELKQALLEREKQEAKMNINTNQYKDDENIELGYVTDEELKRIREMDEALVSTMSYNNNSVHNNHNTFNDKNFVDEESGMLTDEALASIILPSDTEESMHNKCLRVLRSVFRHSSFRAGQWEAIRSVLQGKSSLVILSTGGGKSLCYQLPAFLLSGMCIVVSPLVALMSDQCASLPTTLKGAIWSGQQSADEISTLMSDMRENRIKVLYVSPEKVITPGFQRFMTGPNKPLISFVCIDEVHTVSQWSHNFRPCYLLLSGVLRNVLNIKCILGLTATATHTTATSVCESLNISSDNIIRANHPRHNLRLTVSMVNSVEKQNVLVALIKSAVFAAIDSIIVYVQLQRDADVIAQYLTSYGIGAGSYHAGKSAKQRKTVQDRFMSGMMRVVVATIAFGMGLDKSDVRAVIHYTIPQSLESYVQEVGRAGRDGKAAYCHCFITSYDVARHRNLLASKPVQLEKIYTFLHRLVFTRDTYKNYNNKNHKRMKYNDEDDGGSTSKNERQSSEVNDFVCISEEKLRNELEMEVEVASTILAYVQTHSSYYKLIHNSGDGKNMHNSLSMDNSKAQCKPLPYINFISQVHSTCTIKFHGDCPSILAQKWTVVNGILSIYNRALPADVKDGEYTVSLSQLAFLLRADIGDMQRELLRLRWQRQCTIKWLDPALCVQIMRTPSEDDIRALSLDIHKNFTRQEDLQLSKVDTITTVFNNVMLNDWQHVYPHKSSNNATTSIDVESTLKHGDQQSNLIHSMIDQYLMCQDEMNIKETFCEEKYKLPSASHNPELQTLLQRSSTTLSLSRSQSSLASTTALSSSTSSFPPSDLLSSYYSFLRRNEKSLPLSKLPDEASLARIALGISSPSPFWSASMWRNDGLWGKYSHGVEFTVLRKYAEHALRKWKERIMSAEQKHEDDAEEADEDEERKKRREKVLMISPSSQHSRLQHHPSREGASKGDEGDGDSDDEFVEACNQDKSKDTDDEGSSLSCDDDMNSDASFKDE